MIQRSDRIEGLVTDLGASGVSNNLRRHNTDPIQPEVHREENQPGTLSTPHVRETFDQDRREVESLETREFPSFGLICRKGSLFGGRTGILYLQSLSTRTNAPLRGKSANDLQARPSCLIPETRGDRERSLLEGEVLSQVGFPGLLVFGCKFKIEVPDEICRSNSEFYRRLSETGPFDVLVWILPSIASGFPTQAPGPEQDFHRVCHSVPFMTSAELTERKRHKRGRFMDELSLWYRTLNQTFRHEPAVRPEGVWEGGEVSWIALDREEIDKCRGPLRDIAESS